MHCSGMLPRFAGRSLYVDGRLHSFLVSLPGLQAAHTHEGAHGLGSLHVGDVRGRPFGGPGHVKNEPCSTPSEACTVHVALTHAKCDGWDPVTTIMELTGSAEAHTDIMRPTLPWAAT